MLTGWQTTSVLGLQNWIATVDAAGFLKAYAAAGGLAVLWGLGWRLAQRLRVGFETDEPLSAYESAPGRGREAPGPRGVGEADAV